MFIIIELNRYDTCNSDKDECEKNFRECLLSQCNLKSTLITVACNTTAKLMHTTVNSRLGCAAFKKAQNNSCLCINKENVSNKLLNIANQLKKLAKKIKKKY